LRKLTLFCLISEEPRQLWGTLGWRLSSAFRTERRIPTTTAYDGGTIWWIGRNRCHANVANQMRSTNWIEQKENWMEHWPIYYVCKGGEGV